MAKELYNQNTQDTVDEDDRFSFTKPGQAGAKNILWSKLKLLIANIISEHNSLTGRDLQYTHPSSSISHGTGSVEDELNNVDNGTAIAEVVDETEFITQGDDFGLATGLQIYEYLLTKDVVIDADYVQTEENYTTEEKSKLTNIEEGATADQTGTEIVSAIDTELGTVDWKTGGNIDSVTADEEYLTADNTDPANPVIELKEEPLVISGTDSGTDGVNITDTDKFLTISTDFILYTALQLWTYISGKISGLIGTTIQAFDADTVIDADYVHTEENYTTVEKAKVADALVSGDTTQGTDGINVTDTDKFVTKGTDYILYTALQIWTYINAKISTLYASLISNPSSIQQKELQTINSNGQYIGSKVYICESQADFISACAQTGNVVIIYTSNGLLLPASLTINCTTLLVKSAAEIFLNENLTINSSENGQVVSFDSSLIIDGDFTISFDNDTNGTLQLYFPDIDSSSTGADRVITLANLSTAFLTLYYTNKRYVSAILGSGTSFSRSRQASGVYINKLESSSFDVGFSILDQNVWTIESKDLIKISGPISSDTTTVDFFEPYIGYVIEGVYFEVTGGTVTGLNIGLNGLDGEGDFVDNVTVGTGKHYVGIIPTGTTGLNGLVNYDNFTQRVMITSATYDNLVISGTFGTGSIENIGIRVSKMY